jgi:hypothetical protein
MSTPTPDVRDLPMFSLYIVKMMTFTSGMVFFKNGGYFCSVHLRHSKIKQDQIWTQQLGFLNGLGAVRRLTADLHVAPGPEKHFEDASDDAAVISDQDLFGHTVTQNKS